MKTCSIGKKEMKTRNWEGRVLAKNILDIRRKLPKIKFELILIFQISITYWARYSKYLYILPFIKTGAQSSKIGKNYKNCTLLPFFCAWWFHEFFSFRFVVHCDHSPKNLGSLCCLVYVRWTFLLNLILPSKSCLTASHGMMKGIFATENNILASQNFFWLL